MFKFEMCWKAWFILGAMEDFLKDMDKNIYPSDKSRENYYRWIKLGKNISKNLNIFFNDTIIKDYELLLSIFKDILDTGYCSKPLVILKEVNFLADKFYDRFHE